MHLSLGTYPKKKKKEEEGLAVIFFWKEIKMKPFLQRQHAIIYVHSTDCTLYKCYILKVKSCIYILAGHIQFQRF